MSQFEASVASPRTSIRKEIPHFPQKISEVNNRQTISFVEMFDRRSEPSPAYFLGQLRSLREFAMILAVAKIRRVLSAFSKFFAIDRYNFRRRSNKNEGTWNFH